MDVGPGSNQPQNALNPKVSPLSPSKSVTLCIRYDSQRNGSKAASWLSNVRHSIRTPNQKRHSLVGGHARTRGSISTSSIRSQ